MKKTILKNKQGEELAPMTRAECVITDDNSVVATKKYVDSKVGSGGADWNAKEGEPGYIQNKPFDDIVETKIFETTTDLEASENADGMMQIHLGEMLFLLDTFNHGEQYKVVINNQEYLTYCSSINIMEDLFIYNYDFISDEFTDPSKLPSDESQTKYFGTWTISIRLREMYFYYNKDTFKNTPIEKIEIYKFKPSLLDASKLNMKQIQSDWNADEWETNGILNRPFYENINIIGVEQDDKWVDAPVEGYEEQYIGVYNNTALLNFRDTAVILGQQQITTYQHTVVEGSMRYTVFTTDPQSSPTSRYADDVIAYSSTSRLSNNIHLVRKKQTGGSIHQRIEVYTSLIKPLDSKFLPIVQEIGDSETSVMSQKAVSDEIATRAKVWTGTRIEYDAIETKDSNTFYVIKEEEYGNDIDIIDGGFY